MRTGEILSKLISEKGVTSYEVSKSTGISESTISRMLNKNSKPNIKNRQILAKYFNVSEQYLINGVKSNPTTVLTKDGVAFSITEVSLFVVNNFDEFLKEKIFSNAVELKIKEKIIENLKS